MSGEAEATSAVTHLMLGRKLNSQSQHAKRAKLTGIWEKGVKVFVLNCLV